MNIPQGYKRTELGIIPEDWEVKRISDFTSIITGGTPSTQRPEYWGGSIMWMSSGELNKKFVFDVEGRITTEGLLNSSTHIIPPFCVLIGLAGQGKTRGTAAYNYISLCTNQSIAAILPNDKYNSLYLYYVVDSKYEYLRLLSSGDGGRGGLNKNLLNSLEISFPKTIAEQQAIAEALSDIDGLIAAVDKKIAKKRLIKQGAMQQLLTGKKRLPGFSGPWMERKLGAISHIKTGSCNGDQAVDNGKYPFFVRSQKVYAIDSYSYDGEAILVPGEGGIGSIFHYINGKFDYHQRVYKISDFADNVCGKYIFFYMSRYFGEYALSLTVKATVDSLRLPTFEEFVICMPLNIEEQQAIATILNDMDKEIDDLEAQRDKYRLLKSGMMQKLLTGQIRLKIK